MFFKKNNLINITFIKNYLALNNHIIKYPSPINLNYLWSFGFLAALTLVIQLISGLLITMYFTPNTLFAFFSVDRIMRDVSYGWLIRFIHSNGASMFFVMVYCHIFKNLYYSSFLYPREYIWYSGIILLFLLMGTGFMGYVLPWGQMSYWGVTVITNFVTVLPHGKLLLTWIWGGFSVNNNTLNRFFMLHYLLPFLISALAIIHLLFLHNVGSNNPLIIKSYDNISLYPYFIIKDFFFFIIYLIIFSYFVLLNPIFLNHADNFIEADPLVTPMHIQPEWYFLPYYAILRSIPLKIHGIILMLLSILILFFIPNWNIFFFSKNNSPIHQRIIKSKDKWFGEHMLVILRKHVFTYKKYLNNIYFNSFYTLSYFLWLFVVICLTILGSSVITNFSVEFGILCTLYYFSFFIYIIPLMNFLQRTMRWLIRIKYTDRRYKWRGIQFIEFF
jgi:quinol-cytochrome oxidoreductase complex cytochrome b subunit